MNTEKKHLLPQFPLSIVSFPGESVNLHIFEERYRQLIQECYDNNTTFGIPPFHNGELIFYGTEMKVLEISKVYDDGKMDIKTKGQRVYQIHQFEKTQESKLYPAATVSYLLDEQFRDPALEAEILDKMSTLFEILKIDKPIKYFMKDFSSYSVAHHIGLDMTEKIKLLTMRSESQRLEKINKHLNKFIPSAQKAENLKKRAALNGHFKNLQSPEF